MRPASLGRLLLLAALWGSGFLWIAIALRGLSPLQIVLARLALGTAVLLVIVRRRRLALPTQPRTWAHLAVAALLANTLPYTLFGISEQHIPSSVAGTLNSTTPLWTLAFAFLAGHNRTTSPARLVGILTGFTGTLIIFSPWQQTTHITTWGGAASLLAAASYGASYVYMDRHLARRGLQPLVLAASQLLAATAQALLATPLAGLQPPQLRPDVIAAIAILGVLGTGAAYVLNYQLITDEGTTASVVTYLLPIVALTLGAAVLAEPLTPQTITGTTIVLTGIALTRR